MIKLFDILLENSTRVLYEDSICDLMKKYKISKNKKDGSAFTTFTIKDARGNKIGEFCRLVTNNSLNQLDGFDGPVYEMIKSHDLMFAKKNRLKIRS